MQIASAISTLASPQAVAQDIGRQLGEVVRPDLLMVFVSFALAESFGEITASLRETMKPESFVAVVGESVLGGEREVEREAGVSAMAIRAPGASLQTFHLGEDEWGELLTNEQAFASRLNPEGDADSLRALILFGDPFTTPIDKLLEACSAVFPRAPVIGGMASGMQRPGETRLALDDEVHSTGTIGVALSGNIQMDCVVSQGCRPVGETMVVTKSHHNVIEQLDGRTALSAIEEMIVHLPPEEKELAATGGLLIGRVIDEGKGNYGRGDFLIRSLVGLRRDTGAILIGDLVRTGQTLQFHVRDAKSAHEEMRLLLEGESLLSGAAPAGVLLVTCNGRGTRLFEAAHHDISLTREILGTVPVAGFFAAGELGPVGDRNFIHGHTAVMAVFREPAG